VSYNIFLRINISIDINTAPAKSRIDQKSGQFHYSDFVPREGAGPTGVIRCRTGAPPGIAKTCFKSFQTYIINACFYPSPNGEGLTDPLSGL
jgi:hypothetical protein